MNGSCFVKAILKKPDLSCSVCLERNDSSFLLLGLCGMTGNSAQKVYVRLKHFLECLITNYI